MLPDVRADGRSGALNAVLDVLDIDGYNRFHQAYKRRTVRCATCKCKHVATVNEQVDCIFTSYSHSNKTPLQRSLPAMVIHVQPVIRSITITGTISF